MEKLAKITGYFFLLSALLAVLLAFSNPLFFNTHYPILTQKIFDRFFGHPAASVQTLNTVFVFTSRALQGLLDKPNLTHINMEIPQKNILSLLQGELSDSEKKTWTKASFYTGQNTGSKLRAKVRLKGDRIFHKESVDKLSFRVNLKGDDRFEGLEEFSIQRPILRNYSWEYLMAATFEKEGLLVLKQFPVSFSVNGTSRGIYSIEEVPSSVTLERQLRKNGPIFGMDESLLEDISGRLDLYNENKWKNSPLVNYSQQALYQQFQLAQNSEPLSGLVFDMNEWAKFAALIDFFGAYHGSLPKSVKFYFNPTIGKFQPLLFDAHIGAGRFENFITLDFLTNGANASCSYICNFSGPLYKGLLNNSEFLEKYLMYLRKFTNSNFIDSVGHLYEKKFLTLDNYFYSKLMPSDANLSEGFGLYFLNLEHLKNRKKIIEDRLKIFEEKRDIYIPQKVGDIKTVELNLEQIELPSGTDFVSALNLSLKSDQWAFEKPTVLFLKGTTVLKGESKEQPLMISGPVKIVQTYGSMEITDVTFDGLQDVEVLNRNWPGSLNIIGATFKAKGMSVKNNTSEDAVNLVSSNFEIVDLNIQNSGSDGLDLDFSTGEIGSLACHNIGNDCLDASESKVTIERLQVLFAKDKAISAGENSNLMVKTAEILDSDLGIVSKDGATVEIGFLFSSGLKLDFAAFVKKTVYGEPTLNIIESENALFGLASEKSVINIPNDSMLTRLHSPQIEGKMYGNQYGVKTIK